MSQDVKIDIKTTADNRAVDSTGKALNEVSSSASTAGKEGEKAAKKTGIAWKETAGNILKAVNPLKLLGAELRFIRNVALAAGAALTGIAIKGVKSFMEADDASKSLSASLTALGYNTNEIMPKFEALASEIQKLTRIGDDETLSLAATLLNFGVMPEKIDESIRGVIGLSTAMRMDLGSAAQYLALAQQGQFTMLARYIPALRTATTDTEKMAIVQKVMAAGFEQSQAAAGTLGGRWDQLKNRVGDLWEKIGQTVSESLNLTGAFEKAENAVNNLIGSAAFDKIATGLRSAVSYVVTQVKTVYDLIQNLKAQDFGMARIATVGKTIVTELITMAVTLLVQLIQANTAVFVAIAKIVAATFKGEIGSFFATYGTASMKEDASLAGQKAFSGMSYQDREKFAKDRGRSQDGIGASLMGGDPQLIGELLAGSGNKDLQKAIEEVPKKIEIALDKVDAQWTTSKAKIKESSKTASGGTFDWDTEAADNRAELDTFFNQKSAAPLGNMASRRVAPGKSSAQLEKELEDLQLQQTAAQRDQQYAAGQTPQEQALSRFKQQNAGRSYASNSFSAREGSSLSSAAAASRKEADKAAEEAAATLSSISGMMSTLVSGLKDLEGQMKNQSS